MTLQSVLNGIDQLRPVRSLIEEYNVWNLASLNVGDTFECQGCLYQRTAWYYAYIVRMESPGSFLVRYCVPEGYSWIQDVNDVNVAPMKTHLLPLHHDFKPTIKN